MLEFHKPILFKKSFSVLRSSLEPCTCYANALAQVDTFAKAKGKKRGNDEDRVANILLHQLKVFINAFSLK